MSYAQDTSVSTEKSLSEIRRTLVRYDATSFGYMEQQGRVSIGFELGGRTIKVTVVLPERSEFAHTETGRDRKPTAITAAWEQACRQRYRALALVIKAKLEAVEAGISTVEREFFANLVLPSGQTVGDALEGQVLDAITSDQPLALEGARS